MALVWIVGFRDAVTIASGDPHEHSRMLPAFLLGWEEGIVENSFVRAMPWCLGPDAYLTEKSHPASGPGPIR